MKIFSGSLSTGLRHRRKQRLDHVVRVLPVRRGLAQLGIVLAFGILLEQRPSRLPDRPECARGRRRRCAAAWSAASFPRSTGTRGAPGPAWSPGRARRHRTLQPRGFGEIILAPAPECAPAHRTGWPASRRPSSSAFRRTRRLCRAKRPPDPPRPPLTLAPPGTIALPWRISKLPPKKSSTLGKPAQPHGRDGVAQRFAPFPDPASTCRDRSGTAPGRPETRR